MSESTVVPTVSLKPLLSEAGRRDPFPHYARLHEAGTVCRVAGDEQFDFIVHGFDATSQVLRDPVFHVMDAEYPDRRAAPWRDHSALRTLLSSIFFTDGPDHARVRRAFSSVFTARRVAKLEPAVVRLIDQRLDRLAELGAGGAPVDFMSEFALPLPSDVIGELLGVPEADRPWFPERVRAFGAILDLGAGAWGYLRAADKAAAELTAYFADLVATRRAAPRDDLISALVRQQEEVGLDDQTLIANLLTMFNAGFVTTTHLIGNGLTLLLDRPRLRDALLAEPDRAPAYVEEILRYEPPTHFSIRWATEDTEIDGTSIPVNSRILVMLGAANRDPRRFAWPDAFDPMRTDNQVLSFGSGVHYCLGVALSRLEGQLALPMVLRRFPGIAVSGEPGERKKLMLRGYDRLAVTLG
jgi:cytochrome P450